MKALLLLPLLGLILGCDPAENSSEGNAGKEVARSGPAQPVPRDLSSGPEVIQGKLPGEDTEIRWLVPNAYKREPYYCGDIGYIDLGSASDGPAYYFRREDGFVIGRCGGACMIDIPEGRCARECPPAQWTCRPFREPSFNASLAKPRRPR
ncbi:MAG TPA: hypothetical protein VF620_09725 [Allosphingosinicella sp.]|jgi:hypothetical protein